MSNAPRSKDQSRQTAQHLADTIGYQIEAAYLQGLRRAAVIADTFPVLGDSKQLAYAIAETIREEAAS